MYLRRENWIQCLLSFNKARGKSWEFYFMISRTKKPVICRNKTHQETDTRQESTQLI
jgi:hypothetical protein